MVTFSHPYCGGTAVIKFGTNRSGTPRCCGCERTFNRRPESRAMTPEHEALILGAQRERLSQRGIARRRRE